MERARVLPLLLWLLLSPVLSAQEPAPLGAIPVVAITVDEYAYEAPDTIQAGRADVRLVNRGEQSHGATIVRLEEGRTLEEYLEAYGKANRTGGPRPDWAMFHGGPAASAGGEANAIVDLEPGRYPWVCFAPGEDGVVHLLGHEQRRA